jgi:hypothetical protein
MVFQPFQESNDYHMEGPKEWVPVSRLFGKGMTHVYPADENRTISKIKK